MHGEVSLFFCCSHFEAFKGAGTRVYTWSLHKEGAYGDNLHKGRRTDQIQAGILEKENEKNVCLVPVVREKSKTAHLVTFAIKHHYRISQSEFTLLF